MSEANVESERSERIQILGRVYRLGSIYRNTVPVKSCLPVYGSNISHWGTKAVAFVRQ